jgi:hypothetical protein
VLGIISGLRDIFVPGFFTISPQVRGTADIVMQFVAAALFLILAVFASKGGFDRRLCKK